MKKANILSVLTGVGAAGWSIAGDQSEADAVFAAAREANSRFVGMSNDEIVEYCQGLDGLQLDGMVSLVHGRYFEEMVAEETGGVLFEAKNHPDTDMWLSGQEISIKSHDATAESITGFETISPRDIGLDDDALIEHTAEVLDGDIIDITEAVLSGAVGFGTIATLQAIGETAEEWSQLNEYEKTNGRAVYYSAKATTRAAVGTAKSTWNLLKLAGKGMSKAYEMHQEYKKSGYQI